MPQTKMKLMPSLQDIIDHPRLLKFIDDIPENYHLQLAAIISDGSTIQYVNDPDKNLQLAAVMSNGLNIEYIDNPDENLRMVAIKNNAFAIECINNVSQEECLEACSRNGEALDCLDEDIITEEMIFCAIKSKPSIILDMTLNVTERMKEFAIDYQPSLIGEIEEPSEHLMLIAVRHNGFLIECLQYLDIPQRVKDEAVKQNPIVELYIKD